MVRFIACMILNARNELYMHIMLYMLGVHVMYVGQRVSIYCYSRLPMKEALKSMCRWILHYCMIDNFYNLAKLFLTE